VFELLFTRTAPLLWLLLNENADPGVNVVASGSLIVCPPDPVIKLSTEDDLSSVIWFVLAGIVERVPINAFAAIFALESRNTTEFVPTDVVTPVPPLVTFKVPSRAIMPLVATLGVNPVVPALNDVTCEVPRIRARFAVLVMPPWFSTAMSDVLTDVATGRAEILMSAIN
jgi:hypothetical protein